MEDIRSDHDLLIELKVEFKVDMLAVRDDIRELKNGTGAKIHNLEAKVVDLEKSKNTYFVMMALYTAGVAVMIGLMLLHIF